MIEVDDRYWEDIHQNVNALSEENAKLVAEKKEMAKAMAELMHNLSDLHKTVNELETANERLSSQIDSWVLVSEDKEKIIRKRDAVVEALTAENSIMMGVVNMMKEFCPCDTCPDTYPKCVEKHREVPCKWWSYRALVVGSR